MADEHLPLEPWREIWNSLEVLYNVEYLMRSTEAPTEQDKFFLDIMEQELFRLTRSLNQLHGRKSQ